MNTVKIFLAESGRIADLRKDFPLYQGQFQNKLLNVYVPTSILAPQYDIQHYIGQMSGVSVTSDELNAFVVANTYPSREPSEGDIVEFYNTNTEATDKFIKYTFYNNAWSSTVVESFGTFTTLAGTSVKIGMTAIQRNGSVYKSKSYFMRYLKTLTYQNVEYALYERKLPKEFTLYAGQGVNAPILIANVVNVNMGDNATNYEVTSIITSQTCSLDVMTSTVLDQDPTVEPSDMELITAQINSLSADILLKQDKIDDELNTTSKSVVGGINELNSQVITNTTNIGTNTEDIADIKLEQITQNNDIDENKGKIRDNSLDISVLQGKVATLEEQAITGENPIGELSGTSAPSDSALTAFVVSETGRQPKGGDVVTYKQIISGDTDKIFKCIYSSATTSWSWYEIPPTEKAANDTYGIVKGAYSAENTTDPTQLNIVGGNIKNVYVLDNDNEHRDIREYLNTNDTRLGTVETKENQNELDIAGTINRVGTLEGSMTNILNGTTAVGKATKADQDGNGNNIISTYMTQQAGATKLELKDYALPRTFNDVSFLTADGYSSEIPETENPIYSVTTQDIGDTEIFQATKTISNVEFQLANKNSYTDAIYVSADILCSVEFRLTTEIYNNNQWVEANVEITDVVNLNANEIRKLSFASTFNSLTDIISVTNGNAIRQTLEVITSTSSQITFDIYSNSTYPSTFYLNTTAQVITLAQGYLGELNYLRLDGSVDNNVLSFTIPNTLQIYNNTQYLLNLNYNDIVDSVTSIKLVYNLIDIPIITPYNYGTQNACTLTDLEQVYYNLSSGTRTWQFCGIFRLENGSLKLYSIMDNLTGLKNFVASNYLSSSTKYGASLSVSGQSVQLKDQNGDNLGSAITTQDTGATSIQNEGEVILFKYYTDFTTTADYVGYYIDDPQEGTSILVTNNNKDTLSIIPGTTEAYMSTNGCVRLSYSAEFRKIYYKNLKKFVEVNDVDNQLDDTSINPIQNKVIAKLIPSQASSSNQLADKNFVNSSIATNTANFIGTFANVTALNSYAGTITNNDYAFVTNSVVTDNGNDFADTTALNAYDKTLLTNFDYAWVINGSKFDLYRFDIETQTWGLRVSNTNKADVTLNTVYNRYKAIVSGTPATITWLFEYTLNNSSFTANQWAAINSGLTSADKTKLDGIEAGAEVNDVTDVQINGTSILSSKVANIVTNTAYDASTNPIATMNDLSGISGGVPEVSTANQVYGTNASGNQTTFNLSDSSKFIQEISDQYVRIVNLGTGIYKLTYSGASYLYYNGTTSTSSHMVTGSSNNGDVYLYVNKTGGSTTYWGWYYIVGSSDYPTIYYGYTSSQSGFLGTGLSLNGIQRTSNLVTSLSSNSTDTQYPSAKCVYDIVGDISTLLSQI